MRLIDADEFKRYIVDGFNGCKDRIKPEVAEIAETITKDFLKDIDVQPTAYDVDKVVNCFEEKIDFHTNLAIYEMNVGTVSEMEQHKKAVKVLYEAIEIVKAGGKDA